ncbi:MAG: hypothetical protein ACPGO3_04860 [Magnetospiraceae bacterium]
MTRALAILVVGATLLITGYGLLPVFSARQPAPAPDLAAIDPFLEKLAAQAAAYGQGETEDGIPIVQPPPGPVYVVAQRFQFSPVLVLKAGATYDLRVMSADVMHGLAIPKLGIGETLIPGREVASPLTPTAGVDLQIRCMEYCGLDHSRMGGEIRVIE